jgi:hypothetical protein
MDVYLMLHGPRDCEVILTLGLLDYPADYVIYMELSSILVFVFSL